MHSPLIKHSSLYENHSRKKLDSLKGRFVKIIFFLFFFCLNDKLDQLDIDPARSSFWSIKIATNLYQDMHDIQIMH